MQKPIEIFRILDSGITVYGEEISGSIERPDLQYLNLLRLCHKNRFFPEQITPEDLECMEREYQTCFKPRSKNW